MAITKFEILNSGEFTYYKPYLKGNRDKDTLNLFLQRAKSKKIKTLSVLSSYIPFIGVDILRSYNMDIVLGYPYGLGRVTSYAQDTSGLLTQFESNRINRPSICWAVNTIDLSNGRGQTDLIDRAQYIITQHYKDKPSMLRLMVDPSTCSKLVFQNWVYRNRDLFEKYGAMLVLGSLMGEREVKSQDVTELDDLSDDVLIKVNKRIKSSEEYYNWLGFTDYIGTPYLDRVLEGY
jgi:hypothetical protein